MTNPERVLLALIALLLLIAHNACDPRRVYEKNVRIENKQWYRDKPLVFEIPIRDTLHSHNIYINLRHSPEYRFSNIYIFVTTIAPSEAIRKDTVEIILARPDGKWLGNGLGDILDYQRIYLRNIKFPYTGKYFMELQHAMRPDPLKHVLDAGIRVERVKNQTSL